VRLTYKGYGKTVPVASNDSEEGRAKNRADGICDHKEVKKTSIFTYCNSWLLHLDLYQWEFPLLVSGN